MPSFTLTTQWATIGSLPDQLWSLGLVFLTPDLKRSAIISWLFYAPLCLLNIKKSLSHLLPHDRQVIHRMHTVTSSFMCIQGFSSE